MEHKGQNTKRRFWNAIAAVAAIALLYAVFSLTGVGCPIKHVTGVSCPGCGMTRAWGAALRLDFAKAFEYHPLWLLPIPGAALLFFKDRLPRRFYRISLFLIIAAFFVVYGIRMADPSDTVVVFRPRNGLVGRALTRLFDK